MRWIVDAMNVVGARPDGWWKDRRGALSSLIERLEQWARTTGAEVTVVLEQPMSPALQSDLIAVRQAPRAGPNSADDEIVRLVRADGEPGDITVVTSDGALSARVGAVGAATFPAGRFRDLLD
ncbi:NYN domain-containing protein [Mycobacterium sp. AMU20-3851]|uniref:NYN domain-containing protein n=1 Tax=Mycobacterium sp. AMU20-3851 TaxID=3122055 RepID=UPI0037549EF2